MTTSSTSAMATRSVPIPGAVTGKGMSSSRMLSRLSELNEDFLQAVATLRDVEERLSKLETIARKRDLSLNLERSLDRAHVPILRRLELQSLMEKECEELSSLERVIKHSGTLRSISPTWSPAEASLPAYSGTWGQPEPGRPERPLLVRQKAMDWTSGGPMVGLDGPYWAAECCGLDGGPGYHCHRLHDNPDYFVWLAKQEV